MSAPFPEVGTPLDQALANAILTKAWEIHAKNIALRQLLHKIDVLHAEDRPASSPCAGCWYPSGEVTLALESK